MVSTALPRLTRVSAAACAAALSAGLVVAISAAPARAATPPLIGLYGSSDPTYDGVFRQSLAILGLHAARHTPRPEAIRWLLRQQCADGGFPSYREPNTTACPPFDPDTFTGGEDSNATALAAQALYAIGAKTAAARAVSRLVAVRQTDGGWEFGIGTGYGSDANSTGLVMGALNAAGVAIPEQTVSYIAGLQAGRTDFATTPAGERGGITFSHDVPGASQLATVQVLPFLTGASLRYPPGGSTSWRDTTDAPISDASSIPVATATGISHWAATYLNGQTFTATNASWAVLSFAADRTGEDTARSTYLTAIDGTIDSSDAGANGLAALAASTLGFEADLAGYAGRIESTLQRDTQAPTARWRPSATALFAGQRLTLTRTALQDNFWSRRDITQSVSWGDGSKSTISPAAGSVSHHYGSGGSLVVRVTASDPSGNRRTTTVATISVVVDHLAPSARLVTPSHPWLRAAWSTVRVIANDTNGIRRVTVRLSLIRGGVRLVYTGTRWVRSTAAAPWLLARRGTFWTRAVVGIRRGRLSIGISAVDRADNRAATMTSTYRVTL